MLNECRTNPIVATDSYKWHLDKVFLKTNGVTHYLWRAIDQHGLVLNILVQPKRDRFVAKRFFGKLLRATGRKPLRARLP